MLKISVVIPTLDAGPDISLLLDRLCDQELDAELELVVIDSSSGDDTAERATRAGARVVTIPRHEFNHGRTRNLGIAQAHGDLVALLTQDALPSNRRWLASLVDTFGAERVAGAYSRVVPRPDASPLVERWVCADAVHREERVEQRMADGAEWCNLASNLRWELGRFNNVASCVRRETLRALPFPELDFGEDLAWGLAAIQAGWTLVYEPRSVVVHSHWSGLARDFARHRADAQLLREQLDLRPRASLGRVCGGGVFQGTGLSLSALRRSSLLRMRACSAASSLKPRSTHAAAKNIVNGSTE